MEGNSEVQVKVTFAPMDFSTAHMKLQVNNYTENMCLLYLHGMCTNMYDMIANLADSCVL